MPRQKGKQTERQTDRQSFVHMSGLKTIIMSSRYYAHVDLNTDDV